MPSRNFNSLDNSSRIFHFKNKNLGKTLKFAKDIPKRKKSFQNKILLESKKKTLEKKTFNIKTKKKTNLRILLKKN